MVYIQSALVPLCELRVMVTWCSATFAIALHGWIVCIHLLLNRTYVSGHSHTDVELSWSLPWGTPLI